jgi:hypothetical protein
MSDAAEKIGPEQQPAPGKRKTRRRTRHKATGDKVVPLKVPDEFSGMTEVDCCGGCNAERCVISGANVCGHPFKGGQIPPGDDAAMARSLRAKKVLAHRQIDLRGG